MKILSVSFLALILSFTAFGSDTPESLEGVKIVTADEAKDLMAKGSKMYDVRKLTEYAEEHIKDAVSLPYGEKSKKEVAYDVSLDKFDDAQLPAEGMIFQCNGKECWKSYKSAKWALSKGKKGVYWFRGGIPEWKTKNYPTAK